MALAACSGVEKAVGCALARAPARARAREAHGSRPRQRLEWAAGRAALVPAASVGAAAAASTALAVVSEAAR